MKDIKTITEEYKSGDFEKRLNLFLECPLLRNEFIRIEQDDVLVPIGGLQQPNVNKSHGEKSIFYPCRRWLQRCYSLIS